MRDFRVVIGYRNRPEVAAAVVRAIRDNGGSAESFAVDVSNESSVDTFLDQAVDSYGGLDALVNCAAIVGSGTGIIALDASEIFEVLAVNLAGAFLSVQAAARRMALSRGRQGGSIVLLSSEAGKFGGHLISPYAASKAGINAMAIGIARELAVDGIRLNAVSPGIIETGQHAHLNAAQLAARAASVPMGRLGRPEEVAEAILWLLSDRSSYVTGTILSVAGGR